MNKNPHSTHRTSKKEKLVWGAGGITESLVNCLYSLAYPIFAIGFGVSPALIGIAQAIPRMVDAFTDPLMGNISDNTRTRWGRRRPYIFVGAFLVGLFFPIIFMPGQDWTPTTYFIWYTVFSTLFFIGYTIWSIPWHALGLELSDDYNDRTSIQVARTVFAALAGMAVNWVYRLCFVFNENELIGVRYVALIIGGVMLVSGICSALFVREWRPVASQPAMPFWASMKATFSNGAFRLACGSVLCFAGGLILIIPLQTYVMIYHIYEGNRAAGASLMGFTGMLGAVVSAIMLPLGGKLSARIGKRHAAYLALFLIMAGYLAIFPLARADMPYLILVTVLLYQPGIMLMWTLVPSMIADICDLDELQNGRRREASFGAVFQWSWKMAATIAMMLGGFLLSMAGAGPEATANSAVLPEEVMWRIRVLLSVVPTVMALLGLWCIARYPLTEKRVYEIQLELSEIKARAHSGG